MNMKKLLILFTLLFVLALSGLAEAKTPPYYWGYLQDVGESIIFANTASHSLVLRSNGAAGDPAIYFSGAGSTGIYGASNVINHSVSGTLQLRINTTGLLVNALSINFNAAKSAWMPAVTPTNILPAYTFFGTGNTTSGMGLNATGEPSMIASGVEAMRWCATATELVCSGTTTAPSLTWVGDQDTGFSNGVANRVHVVAGGVAPMAWEAGQTDIYRPISNGYSGGVSIFGGSGVASSTTPQYAFWESTSTGLGVKSKGELSIYASNTEAIRVTATSTQVKGILQLTGTSSASISGTTPAAGSVQWDLTNNKMVTFDGSEWNGPGSKLVFAETWADDNASATDIVTQDVYVVVASGTDGAQIATAGVKCTGVNYVTINATNSFTIGANGSGTYKIMFNVSFSGGVNDTYEFHAFKNETIMPNVGIERKLSADGDIGAVSAQGYLALAPNDHISLRVVNHTDADDCIVRMMNFSLFRVVQKNY